jgi:predicted metal-dependent phosphoesterase TrpH
LIYADFHLHTTFSPDSQISPRTLVEKLVDHPTIKAAAVTDHNIVRGVKTVQQLAAPYPDVLIIPGVEITTDQGDIVVLGTEELPPKPWSVENVVDFAKDNACISIAAHPFRELGLGEYAIESHVDAIEVLNGGSSSAANRMARDLAKSAGMVGVGGSDSHRPSELFSVYNEVQAALQVDDILDAIRKGLVSPFASETSIHF